MEIEVPKYRRGDCGEVAPGIMARQACCVAPSTSARVAIVTSRSRHAAGEPLAVAATPAGRAMGAESAEAAQ
jgi:hypothetical protein